MRTTLIASCLTLITAHAAVSAATPPRATHVRALTPGAAALVAQAAERAPAVRTMLGDLERTDLVVFVSDSMAGAAGEPDAYLTFVTRAAGIRYVLIRINRWRAFPSEPIASLGHELQHALEIAAAPEVADAAGLSRLYRRIGWEEGRGQFETRGARATGHRVRDQVAGVR